MIDVKLVTTDSPKLILPRGIRWVYFARCTRACIVRTSEGGQIVATLPRNGRGDLMVPEEFTELYFEFQRRDLDNGVYGSITIFLSNEPLRSNILGELVYDLNSDKIYEPYTTVYAKDFVVSGTTSFLTSPVDGETYPVKPGLDGGTFGGVLAANATSPRRARTYFLHNSQGGFPYAMLFNVAAATRLPVVEMEFVPFMTDVEFFLNECAVEIFGVSAAGQIAIDLMYAPAGYSLVGGASCGIVETDDIVMNKTGDPLALCNFRRSTNIASVCPDDASKLIARRIIDVPINYSGKIDLLTPVSNDSGRQSPVQPTIFSAPAQPVQTKLIVVIQTSGAMQFRELVTARFSVSDPRNEVGAIWI